MHVKPTFFELQILSWMSVFDSKNQANPKFETQVAYLGQTQPKLVTGIFIIVFIISFITIDWFEILTITSYNQLLKMWPYH